MAGSRELAGAELIGEMTTTTHDDPTYELGYPRGPAGVIVELAQRLGRRPDPS